MAPKSKSRILAEVHESAEGLRGLGVISDERMREFDALCLDPVPEYEPDTIAGLRKQWKLTQQAFASALNTSVSTVQKWETGAKKPSGASRKLLRILETKGLSALL